MKGKKTKETKQKKTNKETNNQSTLRIFDCQLSPFPAPLPASVMWEEEKEVKAEAEASEENTVKLSRVLTTQVEGAENNFPANIILPLPFGFSSSVRSFCIQREE